MRAANSAPGRRRTRGGCGCRRTPGSRSARRRRCARRRPAPARCRRRRRGRRRPRRGRRRSSPSSVFVTSRPMPSMTVVTRSAAPQLGGDVERRVLAVAHDDAAADDDVAHVGGRRGEHGARQRVVDGGARRADRVEGDRRQVGEGAGLDAAGVGPAEAERGRARSPSAAAPAASWRPRSSVARRSSSSTARASSSRSMTACESLPSVRRAPASRRANVGPMPSARSRSVVGQMQHEQRAAPSSADVGRRDVGGVDGGEPRRRARRRRRARSTGVAPWAASTCSFSAGCSETWACSGTRALAGPRGDDGDRCRIDGAHRVHGGADAHAGTVGRSAAARAAQASASPSEKRRCTGSSSTPGPPRR